MNRREFIAGSFGATALAGCRMFTGGVGDFDENLTVLFADPHVNANQKFYTLGKFRDLIAEILRMRPLPRHVVCLGDLAHDCGRPKDYAACARELKALTDAGIVVSHALGNHDRRGAFSEAFPEIAAASPVPGRIVTEVKLPTCDLLLLDGLQGKDGEQQGSVFGALDDAQQEWLAAELKRRTRPYLVASHFGAHELSVKGTDLRLVLGQEELCAGYVHGHHHFWRLDRISEWQPRFYTKKFLCIPSSGYWGDIGYVLLRTESDRAVASLVQTDFWYPRPIADPAKRPAEWAVNLRENQGLRCSFVF